METMEVILSKMRLQWLGRRQTNTTSITDVVNTTSITDVVLWQWR